ncbi:MAG: FliI/YscN family ATPase [Deltaproteobacteria bacterium]|nr:FliI/YscN family ATPase [Deltaproteobacteria bacterium]
MEALKLNDKVYNDRLAKALLYRERGRLTKSVGLTFEGFLPGATVGSIVRILPNLGHSILADAAQIRWRDADAFEHAVHAEVIGFRDKRAILMPLDDIRGVSTSSKIALSKSEASVAVGDFLLGRVIDGKGDPIDGKGPLVLPKVKNAEARGIYGSPVNPLDRTCISEPLDLGVRAINGFLTCGKGQRVGIMAGSGVGKSVLLGMMARHTKADVNVIALIGERGREVNEFLERDLGPEGLKRSVVVVSTSEKSPLLRMRGAFIAATIAEYFCDQGLDVLVLMDSITRFCMAQREIGLSMGEPPASKGYTPSVFSTLPKLLERAGTRAGKGSITGLYTVLVEGDDMDEPIADASRAILDGHIVLSRRLASRNHYPAIDVAESVSRVMRAVIDERHRDVSGSLRELMAIHAANEDLISIGAYVKGSNPKLDQAIAVIERVRAFLRQDIDERSSYEESVARLESILAAAADKA